MICSEAAVLRGPTVWRGSTMCVGKGQRSEAVRFAS